METNEKLIETNIKTEEEIVEDELQPDVIIEETIKQEEIRETQNPKRYRIDKLLSKQDIKFRGIFSHRAVKILGFVFMFLAQVVIAANIGLKYIEPPTWAEGFISVLEVLSIFALPMFLTANFCSIMTSQSKIKTRLITYSAIAIGIYLLILFLFYRYLYGLGDAISDDPEGAFMFADTMAKRIFGKIINYNVFVDLSLFSLFYYFLFYKPKKITKKVPMIIFRSMSVLPVICAIVATIIYGLYYQGTIDLSVPILAILPCRSIIIYTIFFAIAIVIKLRQELFIKWGGTVEEYNNYAKTNRSSLEMSILASIVIFVLSAVDLILFINVPMVIFYGIGFNFYFAFTIPFIFLLSYTRKVKKSIWDILMVVIFIVAVIFLYLELGLFIVRNLLW